MKKTLKSVFSLFGISSTVYGKNKLEWRAYNEELNELKRQKGEDATFYFGKSYPILGDRYSNAGTLNGHYFHQDLYVARRIYINNPVRHIDVGSRIDGFVAHVAVFRTIEIFDIRKQNSKVKNIIFQQADLMQLPGRMINYCDSISSLHAIEHFGLGRYGDPIDYWGYIKGLKNITMILKKGGRFYFSVPIGSQRIEFNAHRVFSVKYLVDILKDDFDIERFSYVDDNGDFCEDAQLTENSIESNFNCNHGCGIFELLKK